MVLLVLAALRIDVLGILSQISTDKFFPPQAAMLVHTNARVRSCPERSCDVIAGLKDGDVIHPQNKVSGEAVNGNNIWIEFKHNNLTAYVWSGLVSAQATRLPQSIATRRSVATKAPAATEQPTFEKTEVAMWSPRMCSYVYRSSNSPAVPIGRINSSDTIQELGRVEFRGKDGDITFLEFMYNGEVAYVNGGRLSTARPPYFPTNTPVAYTCNCNKVCENMTCDEAFFQLVKCGCGKRDNDNNAIPCNARCEC